MTIIIDDDGIGHKVITLAELDKMRSEIDKMDYLSIEDGSDGYDHYIDKHDVFQIIDEYRGKQE